MGFSDKKKKNANINEVCEFLEKLEFEVKDMDVT